MAIQLHLSHDEAGLLSEHLSRHLERLSAELVRTEKRELHHALAREITALQAIADRLEDAAPSLRAARPPADVAR